MKKALFLAVGLITLVSIMSVLSDFFTPLSAHADAPVAPTLTTGMAGSITQTGATISDSSVDDPGSASVNYEGVTWDTSPGNAYGDYRYAVSASDPPSATFTVDLFALDCGTTYYYRAYALNGDIVYGLGDEQSFTTASCDTVTAPSIAFGDDFLGRGTYGPDTWNPSVDWDTSDICQYSYDAGVTFHDLDCGAGGTDIPPPDSDGAVFLYIAGSFETTGVSIATTVIYDSVAPSVSIGNPGSGDTIYESAWTNPAVSWDDASTCQYSYDDVTYYDATCSSGGSDIPPPDGFGSATLYVRGADYAGNRGTDSIDFDYHADVYGCMDVSANNYDSSATQDDGSCTYEVLGCMDPSANNYDVEANVDDGSCSYDPPPVPGCTDPAAVNYDPDATVDDSSCTYDDSTAPPVFADDSGEITDITGSSVVVNYDVESVGSAALAHFELHYADDAYYTVHSDYGENAPITFDGSFGVSGATDVRDLSCGTTYHFIQSFRNADNETAISSDATFTTSDCTPPFASGSGTSEDPYTIEECAQFENMNDYLDSSFILENSLDCTGEGNDIMIGGVFSDAFTGDFDGNGKSITVDIEDPAEPGVGLFRSTDHASVRNLTLADGSEVTGLELVGSIAGIAIDSTFTHDFSHAVVSATAPNNADYPFIGTGGLIGGLYGGAVYGSSYDSILSSALVVGGIAGFVGNDLGSGDGALISRSWSDAHIYGQFGAGGIAGYMESQSRIRNSYAEGTVQYSSDFDPASPTAGGFGGLVGLMNNGLISRSYAAGLVRNTNDNNALPTGGLVGAIETPNDTTIVHSFVVAQIDTVDAGALVGGISGGGGDMFSGMLDNYYDTSRTGLIGCIGGDLGPRNQCASVDGHIDSYWLQTTGTPLAAWNAADVWDFSGEDSEFPTLSPYFEAELAESDDTTPPPPPTNGTNPVETILTTNHYQGGGVAQGWNSDDNHWEYDLPFDFTFYGQTYNRVYIDSNGYLTFSDGGGINAYDVSVATGIGVPAIFAYGNDLLTNQNTGDDIYITDEGDGQVIFRWQATDIENHDSIANFEIVLKNDSTFEINYGPQTKPINDATAVGVSDGAGTYATSTYDGRTDFNELDTSSWGAQESGGDDSDAPAPQTEHQVHSGSSASVSFHSPFGSVASSTSAGLADIQAKFAAIMALYQKLGSPIQGVVSGLPSRDVKVGATGSDVSALQAYLIAHGYAIPAGATGYFGSQTRAALAAYQKAHGITPAAGYFGPITRAMLEGRSQ